MTGVRRYRAADDAGASLLLALALVTFLGLVIAALLTFSSTSLRSTKAAASRATTSYGSDGALKTAINQVRNSSFNNDAGQTCPDLVVPAPDGTGTTVTCTARAGTGGDSEKVPLTAGNTPAQAVLTLGTNAGELGIAQKSNNVLKVQGKVFSSGAIDSGPGTLQDINAQVVARGTCSGRVISSDAQGNVVPNVCSAPASAIPADPGYPQPTAGLVYRPLPSCNTGSTVEFSPGYYDDAVGLSAMTSGTGVCKGKTFLFQAGAGGGVGVYYFDFHNGEGGGLPGTSRVWTIGDATASIVGGTPRGWVPDVSSPTIPGSCVSPLTTTVNDGVQFAFGGDSRIELKAGSMELCGQYSSTTPAVAIYGAKTGANVVSGPVTATTDGTGTNPTNGPAFANPARITATDGSPATAVLDATTVPAGVTGSVVVEGYAPPTAIPAGSILTAANLVVVHRDNNATSSAKLRLLQLTAATTRVGGIALANVPQPTAYQDGATGTTYHTDNLNVLASLATEVHDNGFTGLRVRYDAGVAGGNKVTENLDSIQLSLSWRPPGLRAETTAVNGVANCVGAYPGCPLLTTSLNNTALYIQGTTYAPLALMDVNLTNTSAQVFRAGLVLRALQVQLTASTSFSGPLIEVPNQSAGPVALEVYFRAFAAAKVIATARVRFPATDPTLLPTPGHRDVSVLSWTIRRG